MSRPVVRSGRHRADTERDDETLSLLYAAHYASMTRLAALLAGDARAAEDIADSAFADTRSAWRQLGHVPRSAELLRRRVVIEARRYRRQRAADRTAAGADPEAATASAKASFPAAVHLLHQLPGQQLEVLVLRCYSGLSIAEIGAATGAPGWKTRRSMRRGMSVVSAAMAALLSDSGAFGAGESDDASSRFLAVGDPAAVETEGDAGGQVHPRDRLAGEVLRGEDDQV